MSPSLSIPTLPDEVAEQMGYYVYLYIDPRSNKPFYVGKGCGARVLSHLDDPHESEKTRHIAELREQGLAPRLEVLSHGMPDEATALRVEAAAIDLLGLTDLTNAVRGARAFTQGRMTLDQLRSRYAARELVIEHDVLLIRINRLYAHDMPSDHLYEVTRGVWRVGARRTTVKFAFAVFDQVVREVYSVESWQPAKTAKYVYREQELSARDLSGRWEFVGTVAPDDIRSRYVGGSVRNYLAVGQQNPVAYVNVPPEAL